MTNYDMAQWSDYVRGAVEPDTAQAMREVLKSDESARKTAAILARVAVVGQTDSLLAIPPHAVRIAKAAGSIRRSEDVAVDSRRRPFAVLFDSLLSGALAGTREIQGTSLQQVLYQSDPYTVELRLEQESNPSSQLVIGQLLRHQGEAQAVADVPVLVMSNGEVVGRDITSRFGEFQAAGLPTESLQLCLLVDPSSCIELPLGSN